MLEALRKAYPDAATQLHHANPFQLLVATILSAQCTDERVNKITPALFKRFPDPAAFANARPEDVEEAIRSTGFFHGKAKSIMESSKMILERFGGKVPRDMDSLLSLRGVARKTANVVMLSGSYRFGKTAVAAAPRTDDDKCADELNRTTASLRRELDEQDGEIEKLEQQLDKCQNRDCAQAQAEKAAVKNDEKWPKKHRVKNDDTLRSIAAQYYGSGSKWQIVEEANPSKVSKGLPVVGAELTLPDPKGAKRPCEL